ncbi:MAG TPA: DUF86 domain-containing protein [Anaerolineae bacterium]|nr:DUF86 domain-containing protein [Anaerolineae bacterium]
MKKDDTVFLRHILDAIHDINSYLAGVSYNDFLQHKLIQDAVVRQLEIVGEAATNLSVTLRQMHPGVAWGEIIGMRNRLIHAYFQIDVDIVWEVAHTDLPLLKEQVERMLATPGSSTGEKKGGNDISENSR